MAVAAWRTRTCPARHGSGHPRTTSAVSFRGWPALLCAENDPRSTRYECVGFPGVPDLRIRIVTASGSRSPLRDSCDLRPGNTAWLTGWIRVMGRIWVSLGYRKLPITRIYPPSGKREGRAGQE